MSSNEHDFATIIRAMTITHALAGTLKDEALHTHAGQAGIWVAMTCVRAADACFALGGSKALYVISPLQRRLRDLHTAAQHLAEAKLSNSVEATIKI